MLRRLRRTAPVGATVIYHGSVAELTGHRFTITHATADTHRTRYELSDNAGPLLDNVHAESFTAAPVDVAAAWATRLDAIHQAAARDGSADLVAPYLAEVRTLIARGDQRTARDAARSLEHHVGIRATTRTGPGAHRRR